MLWFPIMVSAVRARAAMVAVIVFGLVAAVAAAFGWWQVAIPALTALLVTGLLTLIDMRRREAPPSDLTQPKRAAATSETSAQIMTSIDTVRHELAAMGEHVRATHDRVTRLEENLPTLKPRKLSALVKDQTREVEALLQLYAKVDPREPMPPSGRWALNPQSLLSLFTLVQRHRPRLVVELGSGTSTVWLGYALNSDAATAVPLASGTPARLISLDHDETFAEQSSIWVAMHADRIAPTDVRFAPLTPVRLGDEEYQWYDTTTLGDVDGIDMLIVDGPPGGTGPQARYPAVPILADRLNDGAVVVLDDVRRDDEKKIIERWLEQNPGLERMSSSVGRQAVFRFLRPDSAPAEA